MIVRDSENDIGHVTEMKIAEKRRRLKRRRFDTVNNDMKH